MTTKELEIAIFSFANREKIVDFLNEDFFDTDVKNYILDFKKVKAKSVLEYTGKGNLSISRLNELIDDLNIVTFTQFNEAYLKLERVYKKRKIYNLLKHDKIDEIIDLLNNSVKLNSNNFKDCFKNYLDSRKKEMTLTGIRRFDEFNGGLTEPELVTIAARPGRGKTALAVQLINNFLMQNKSVYFASLEMSANQIIQRLISNYCKIDNNKIRKKEYSEEEFAKIVEYYEKFNKKNVFLDDNEYLTIESLKYKAKGFDILIIDYFQMLNSERKFKSEFEKLEYISFELKKIAKRNKQIIICLAQLNRESERNGAVLGSIKGAGGIEQNSDIVIFLLTEKDNEIDVFSEFIDFVIVKYREGRTGKIKLIFSKNNYNFSEF